MSIDNKIKYLLFFGFFISFMPFFISVDFNSIYITFSRPGPYYEMAILQGVWKSVYDNVISEFYVTFPVSLVYLCFMIFCCLCINPFSLQNKSTIFGSNFSPLLYVFFVINLWVYFYAGVSKTTFLALLLIVFILIVISLLISVVPFCNLDVFFNILRWSLFVSLLLGFLASKLYVISYFFGIEYVNFPGEILPGFFSIYNFEQYFVLSLIFLFVYLYINGQLNLCLSAIVFFILLLIAVVSNNDTAIISLVFFGLLIINNKWKFISVNFFNIVLVFLGVLLLISVPYFSYFLLDNYSHLIGDPAISGIWARVFIYHEYVSMIGFSNVFVPFEIDGDSNISDPHNQLLTFIVYGGLLYALSFYTLVLCLIYHVAAKLRAVFIYYSIVLGCILEPLLHPFILVQFVFLLSLSIVLNKVDSSRLRS